MNIEPGGIHEFLTGLIDQGVESLTITRVQKVDFGLYQAIFRQVIIASPEEAIADPRIILKPAFKAFLGQ